jgi:undecaprenyl-diphosphatase
MGFWDAVLLGIAEGLTEFLPVSSTFHLIAAARLLGRGEGEFAKLFEVFIQSGAVLAVLVLYWKKLKKDTALIGKILAAFAPTAFLGALAYGTIKRVFFASYFWMIAIFILVGLVFFIFEALVKKGILSPRKALTELSYRDALIIGLVQSLAFFPGVSRAGAVILIMMILGFRRAESAAFSFLLAIPTIFSAGVYDLYKTRDLILSSGSNAIFLLIGSLSAFLVAIVAVKWLIRYLQSHTLNIFGFYRLAAGLLLILAIWFL